MVNEHRRPCRRVRRVDDRAAHWEEAIAEAGVSDHELLVRLLAAHSELDDQVVGLGAELTATADVVTACREFVDLMAAQAAMITSFVERFDGAWGATSGVSEPSADGPDVPRPSL